jgi:tyrosinase
MYVRKGRYDEYIHWHHSVMRATVFPFEPRQPRYRNGAHPGSSFLPWHRAFLLQVETDLRAIDSYIAIPYLDWTADANIAGNRLRDRKGPRRNEWQTITG